METRKRKLTRIENAKKLVKYDDDFMDITGLPRVLINLIKEYLENLLEIYYYTSKSVNQKAVCILGLIKIANGRLISNLVINEFKFSFGFVYDIGHQGDYIILTGKRNFAIYHIPTKLYKEYKTRRSQSRRYNIFEDFSNNRFGLKLYCLGGLKYDFNDKKFKSISDNYIGVRSSVQTSRGIYTFGRCYRRSLTIKDGAIKGVNYINDAMFFDYKTEQMTLLKPSPCGQAFPVVINDDSILLVASPQRKTPWKLGELPVYLYTPSQDSYIKLDFVIPERIFRSVNLIYQNDALFFINEHYGLSIYYLNQPFDKNKIIGPIESNVKIYGVENCEE